MPKGVPARGYRLTRKRQALITNVAAQHTHAAPIKHESDDEISIRIKDRFLVFGDLVRSVVFNELNGLVCSGPPGLGKSFEAEKILTAYDPNATNYEIIKGYVRAPDLYKKLYEYREKGQVLVFDDADSVLFDETSLNLLKAAIDTNKIRRVSYLANYTGLVDEKTGRSIPKNFVFNGAVIFLTNLDFDKLINTGHKLSEHLNALRSRALYVDMTIKTPRDYIIRIRQVVKEGLLQDRGLSSQQQDEVVKYIIDNQNKLSELSLRTVVKLAAIRKSTRMDWKRIADVTLLK